MKNKLMLECIVTKSATMGRFPKGDPYCNFPVGWTGQRGKKKLYFNVYAYKDIAEPLYQSLKIGDKIRIDGYLSGYTSKTGKKYVHIVAEYVKILNREIVKESEIEESIKIEEQQDLQDEISILADS